VVTGNFKEMGYEAVHWIRVAHDQIWKWILQTQERSFNLCSGETKHSSISQ